MTSARKLKRHRYRYHRFTLEHLIWRVLQKPKVRMRLVASVSTPNFLLARLRDATTPL